MKKRIVAREQLTPIMQSDDKGLTWAKAVLRAQPYQDFRIHRKTRPDGAEGFQVTNGEIIAIGDLGQFPTWANLLIFARGKISHIRDEKLRLRLEKEGKALGVM